MNIVWVSDFYPGTDLWENCLFLLKCVIINKQLYVGLSWVQLLDSLGIVSKKNEFLNCHYNYAFEWIEHVNISLVTFKFC